MTQPLLLPTPATLAHLAVTFEVAPTLNFAMDHCGVPLVRDVRLEHRGGPPIQGAILELQLVPDLGEPVQVALGRLVEGDVHHLGKLDYQVPPGKLRQLEEAEGARLRWTVTLDGQELATGEALVDVLAFNEWPGTRAPAPLLTAFVLPNHPEVAPLLQATAGHLEKLTGDPALDGYQRRSPERVAHMAEALYRGIQDLGLTYVGVPASFEGHGQKVRLPDVILHDRMACCLDLALLAAAGFEQAGLHPLVIVLQGHAILALWLQDERFPEGVVEDAARLRTAIALGQIVAFDPTLAVQHSPVSFQQAVGTARSLLEDDDRFLHALDVRVLRFGGFRPLPLRSGTASASDGAPLPEAWMTVPRTIQLADERPLDHRDDDAEPLEVPGRFLRWQERLLDLTLRNKLLNFSLASRGAAALEVPDLAGFVTLLESGQVLDVLPPPVVEGAEEREPGQARKLVPPGEWHARLVDDLRRGLVHGVLPDGELISRLRNLERTARTDQEEGGAHTLYVGVGMLRWFEMTTGGKGRLAPLVLYPISLEFDRSKRRFRFQRLAEDPVTNITLVEKLRRDFSVDLAPLLDLDGERLDVPELLRLARTAIQRMPRWEVREDAHLGLFSFTKFLMWRDLHDNASRLLENPVVRYVAGAESAPPPQLGEDLMPARLDEKWPSAKLGCVVDADASQLSAVAAALAGHSFVLQGPPGTGKSQTITNMIAALLAEGKRVLFVSEKMAALDVVSRNLARVGLGDFCLELHSHKTNKKACLESLAQAMHREERVAPPDWEGRSTALDDLRHDLRQVAAALHADRPLGLSVFEARDRLLQLDDAPEVRYAIPAVQQLTRARLEAWRQAVRELAARATKVEPVASHPLADCRPGSWSSALQEQVEVAVDTAKTAIVRLRQCLHAFAAVLGTELTQAPAALAPWRELVDLVLEGPLPTSAVQLAWPTDAERARAYLDACQSQEERERRILSNWQRSILVYDVEPLIARYRPQVGRFPPLAWFALRRERAIARSLAVGTVPGDAVVLEQLEQVLAHQAEARRLDQKRGWLAQLLEGLWPPDAPLPQAGEVLADVARRLPRLARVAEELGLGTARLVEVARWSRNPPAREALQSSRKALDEALLGLQLATGELSSRLGVTGGQAPWPAEDDARYLDQLASSVERRELALPTFKAWALYCETVVAAEEKGLAPLVDAHARGEVVAKELEPALERNVLARWLTAVTAAEPLLDRFEGESHDRVRQRFIEADQAHMGLARQRAIQVLEARLPAPGAVASESSELGVLLRELKKRARHLPVRKLLQTIPNLVRRLKPCFLMSPLSVAQYLPAEDERFDVVIFDEASQIGTHDAIGAIARGDQVIVVGDSRQLPPTAFFQRQGDEDLPQDENDIVELESILDEAITKRLPEHMLEWHYRSRHDALIDFSNQHYYGGKLNVFPAAHRHVEGLGVRWHVVPDGVYQAGDRINVREAEALVAHLCEALRSTPPETRTFGVVTFGLPQKRLIEELLEERRAQFPEIEGHFAGDEKVFVKNLENVQGDERDEIYFSIGYAPDEQGHMRRMHFGPLSMGGGERRLNVAVTRARRQLRVFSTLTADKIDLGRTSAIGATHLKAFLQYVSRHGTEEGARAAATRPTSTQVASDVHAVLAASGWQVHAEVGCGKYRLDLAVVHPDEPGRYLLAVEVDGPAYCAGKTVRDRERLRHQVLQGLGWHVYRVWSLDWPRDRDRIERELLAAVDRALEASRGAPHLAVEERPAEALPVARLVAAPETPALRQRGPAAAYQQAALVPVGLEPEFFYQPASGPRIREQVLEVVRVEGPVHLDLVCRRLMAAWGLNRLTDRLRRRIEGEVRGLVGVHDLTRRADVLWPAAMTEFVAYRPNPDGTTIREAEHLPPEEVANAAAWLLAAGLSMPYEDSCRETAKLLGFKLTRNVAEAIEAGVDHLVATGRCRREGDQVVWRG